MAFDFVKTLTNKLLDFSFESVNIKLPKSALIANNSMCWLSWWMTLGCLRWHWE